MCSVQLARGNSIDWCVARPTLAALDVYDPDGQQNTLNSVCQYVAFLPQPSSFLLRFRLLFSESCQHFLCWSFRHLNYSRSCKFAARLIANTPSVSFYCTSLVFVGQSEPAADVIRLHDVDRSSISVCRPAAQLDQLHWFPALRTSQQLHFHFPTRKQKGKL